MGYFRQYRQIKKGELFAVGCDTATGLGDYCTAQFISKTELDVPLVYHSDSIATDMTNRIWPVLEALFDITGHPPLVAYERNNGGVFEIERLATLNRKGKFELFMMPRYGNTATNDDDSGKLGWDTNSFTRGEMLQYLKQVIDNKIIRIYDEYTVNELTSFIVTRSSAARKAEAEKNSHDDLVMALAIAMQVSLRQDRPMAETSYNAASQLPKENLFDENGFY
jgi:hypothetical protein